MHCAAMLAVTLALAACTSSALDDAADTSVVAPMPVDSLPAYTVAERVTQSVGGEFGSIIVPTLTRESTSLERERILRGIMAREGLREGMLVCSEEAWRAQFSVSYAESHPYAEQCYLGAVRQGEWVPAEYGD